MFHCGYSVSLCCSVYCVCVNVYCTAATGCQHNRSIQIYINGNNAVILHTELTRTEIRDNRSVLLLVLLRICKTHFPNPPFE